MSVLICSIPRYIFGSSCDSSHLLVHSVLFLWVFPQTVNRPADGRRSCVVSCTADKGVYEFRDIKHYCDAICMLTPSKRHCGCDNIHEFPSSEGDMPISSTLKTHAIERLSFEGSTRHRPVT